IVGVIVSALNHLSDIAQTKSSKRAECKSSIESEFSNQIQKNSVELWNAINLQQISQIKLEFLPKKSKNDLEKLGLLLKVPKEKIAEFIKVSKSIPAITVKVYQKEKSILNVSIIKDTKPYHSDYILYTPKFPKPQKEGWYVLCTSHISNKVHALKRLTMSTYTHGILNTNIIIPEIIYGKTVDIIVISDAFCIKKIHSITLLS
ncbi:unnamed protein product, partial [Pneumocystis jirovecii]